MHSVTQHMAATDTLIAVLVRSPAAVHARDAMGRTPLHLAAMNGRYHEVQHCYTLTLRLLASFSHLTAAPPDVGYTSGASAH